MAKPSIFSKNYEKKMKKRKRIRIASIIISVLIIVILFLFIFKGNGVGTFINRTFKTVSSFFEKNDEQLTPEPSMSQSIGAEESSSSSSIVPVNENKEYAIEDGLNISVILKKSDNTIENVQASTGEMTFDINKDKNEIVILHNQTQNMFLLTISNDVVTNITKAEYAIVGTSGKLLKDETLSSAPGYIWHGTPKFIDNDNIAYISQLPWTNKTEKYVWIYNVKDNSHTFINTIKGGEIELVGLDDKGLQITLNGQIKYLKADKTVSDN